MTGSSFVFPELEGEISVDYRNNDGAIMLGTREWAFSTKWSTAGSGSIHAYRDSGPRVAVAPGVNRIEEVSAEVFQQADFSSRVRTPRVGEVVLWLNAHDYAAAVEVRRVTIAPEGSPGAILEARYRILGDRTRDFSASGTPLDSKLRRAVREALSTFDTLEDIPDPPRAEVGIGHNNPPPEAQLTKQDYLPLVDQLRRVAVGENDEARLRTLISSVQTSVSKISEALESRLRMIREGFYRQLGAMAAVAAAGLAVWFIFYGNLQGLESAAKALATHLFGFQ